MDIRVTDVAKEFGGARALRGVTLHIRSGELMALLGPSGSGKTTLLRIIAGLEQAERGTVHFGDIDATRLSVQERNVGFVFQHYALFRHMSVADNIAYGLRVRPRRERPTRAQISARVEELLALMQLEGLGGRYPAQLSGGQKQRVALARALAVNPRVLLLDEPFGALDAKVRKDLRSWLRQIHERTGHTTIFVTHDQDEALELADRVAILNRGRLEQVGTPDEIHDHPASAFIAAFVGDAARVPVQVRDGRAVLAGRALQAPKSSVASGEGWLWLRPYDLRLAEAAAAQRQDHVAGVIRALRRTANGRRAEVRLDACDAVVEVDAAAGRDWDVGERVALEILGGRVFAGDDE
ncbi:sulfate/molybdate ABC transporter ATP-binding protein [Camelimonas abortus]|uniref:Sulfate/molybdate ABC transporter ATP-binding protein n=1 Tax=Camelimonas abortus TaxID=1017184 RepID=A0ABV7LCA4_9HYPH